MWSLDISQSYGPPRIAKGIALTFFTLKYIKVFTEAHHLTPPEEKSIYIFYSRIDSRRIILVLLFHL
jgi:hypothetical protein